MQPDLHQSIPNIYRKQHRFTRMRGRHRSRCKHSGRIVEIVGGIALIGMFYNKGMPSPTRSSRLGPLSASAMEDWS
jgi:hypothetical protein